MKTPAKKPWNNWFHVVGNTYATWLPGDERGWRARHHREHVEGDYKNPPPIGAHAATLERSKRLQRRPRVILTRPQCHIACEVMARALRFHCVDLVDLCVTPRHYHILARFLPVPGTAYPDRVPIPGVTTDSPISRIRTPRHLVGIAKKESARTLSKCGLLPEGGVWAVRCKPKPIADREHQVRVARYIRAHAKKGAVVWSLIRHLPPP